MDWRYALGEFSIVLLGVLAAFAVENWNSDRKDRLLEIEYIEALLDDLRKDDLSIVSALQGAETFAQRGQLLLTAIDQKELSTPPPETLWSRQQRHPIYDFQPTTALRSMT